MKLIALIHNAETFLAITDGDSFSIFDPAEGWPTSMRELISDQKRLDSFSLDSQPRQWPSPTTNWLPPISDMEKVICIGTNYADHAREMGGQPPEIPVVFSKFPSAIIAADEKIELPAISQQVDFEAELVVVIGKPGRHITRENAMEHVFGYCCGNDISARDWQKGKPGGQWLLGKTFDTFAPLGPMLVTADEIADPHQLDIELRLNGKVMQSSNTRELIFRIDDLISHLSKFMTLKTGDLIFTGTPSGVGAGRTPPVFLKPGDQLEVEIEGLGTLKNDVVAAG